jgi:hypothetical protein
MYSIANLTGPIPASLTNLTNVPAPLFKLYGIPGLCHLNADSAGVTALCDPSPVANQCPYPVCACKWLGCPSGATGPVALNPVSPYYPTVIYCCASGTGNTLRERMVVDGFLDCSTAPCTATAKGLSQVSISYINDAKITGTVPPQIATLTAVTLVHVYSLDNVSGTLPPQLGLMSLLLDLRLDGHAKLAGTIPPQLGGLVALTQL